MKKKKEFIVLLVDAVLCLSLYPADLVGPEINSTKSNILNLSDGNFTDLTKP